MQVLSQSAPNCKRYIRPQPRVRRWQQADRLVSDIRTAERPWSDAAPVFRSLLHITYSGYLSPSPHIVHADPLSPCEDFTLLSNLFFFLRPSAVYNHTALTDALPWFDYLVVATEPGNPLYYTGGKTLTWRSAGIPGSDLRSNFTEKSTEIGK